MNPAGEHPLALLFTDVEGSTGLKLLPWARLTVLVSRATHADHPPCR
jgi:hypothetical protein